MPGAHTASVACAPAPGHCAGGQRAVAGALDLRVQPAVGVVVDHAAGRAGGGIEPSTLCGWTSTSRRSPGRPNRWWAAITSRPLFISVAESTEIFGPIDHLGWATAWAG